MNENLKKLEYDLNGILKLKDQMLDVNQYMFNDHLYNLLKNMISLIKELHPELNEKKIDPISPEEHDKIMAESLADVQILWRKRWGLDDKY